MNKKAEPLTHCLRKLADKLFLHEFNCGTSKKFMLKKMEKEIQKSDFSRIKDGATCKVIGGTHKGKSGTIRDINTSKTGHVTITVVQASGVRFKTLAKNVDLFDC